MAPPGRSGKPIAFTQKATELLEGYKTLP